jgi:hypothetical protein
VDVAKLVWRKASANHSVGGEPMQLRRTADTAHGLLIAYPEDHSIGRASGAEMLAGLLRLLGDAIGWFGSTSRRLLDRRPRAMMCSYPAIALKERSWKRAFSKQW